MRGGRPLGRSEGYARRGGAQRQHEALWASPAIAATGPAHGFPCSGGSSSAHLVWPRPGSVGEEGEKGKEARGRRDPPEMRKTQPPLLLRVLCSCASSSPPRWPAPRHQAGLPGNPPRLDLGQETRTGRRPWEGRPRRRSRAGPRRRPLLPPRSRAGLERPRGSPASSSATVDSSSAGADSRWGTAAPPSRPAPPSLTPSI